MKVSTCSYRPILVPCGLKNFDYQVDTYVGCEHLCNYCYVLNQAETDWSKEIRIHYGIADQLGQELENISPQKIYMGYYSDPYQPCEAHYRQTRNVLELFLKYGYSVSILTKSDLVVRDIDLLREMDDASVGVSVAFNDNRTRRLFEANTTETEARISALRKLREAGIATSALICPVIPHITDVTSLIELLVPHTSKIWIYGLSMQKRSDQNWSNVQGVLNNHFATLKKQIEAAIFSNDHFYWIRLRQKLQRLQQEQELNLSIHL